MSALSSASKCDQCATLLGGQTSQRKLILTATASAVAAVPAAPAVSQTLWLLMLALCLQVAMARQMQLQEQRMKQAREREYNVAFDQYMDHERQQVRGGFTDAHRGIIAREWPHLAGCGHKAARHRADSSPPCLADVLYSSNKTHRQSLPWPRRLCG